MKQHDFLLGERRNFLQIWAQILEYCSKPRTKIRVMQSIGTSFRLTERYLLKLNKLEFLEEAGSSKKYVTTDNGKKFLETWKQLVEMLSLEPESTDTSRKLLRKVVAQELSVSATGNEE